SGYRGLNYTDPFGLCPEKETGVPCDNPGAVGALAHFVGRSGKSLTYDFDRVETSSVSPEQFTDVRAALARGQSGTSQIDSKLPFATESLALGTITLRLEGELTTSCDGGGCDWTFSGTLGAYDDLYDFNRSTHRTKTGEGLTNFGRTMRAGPIRLRSRVSGTSTRRGMFRRKA